MRSHLSGPHQKIYDRVFEKPSPHNLHWRDVWSMIEAIPDVQAVEDEKGVLKASRNGQTLVLHRPRGKDMADKKELAQVRVFLERSGGPSQAPAAEVESAGLQLLVVIDHREARIYNAELKDSVPERIAPYDPFGFGRALHYKQDDSNGQRKPERKSFYEAVAKTLKGAEKILLFGSGTGSASAMEQLVEDLKHNHRELAEKIVGTVAIDEHHMTEGQLLAKARAFYGVAV